MARSLDVYLEEGSRRVFAGVLAWPGWCRSARDEGAALEAVLDYARRYAAAMAGVTGVGAVRSSVTLAVVERLPGDASTDFGAPGGVPSADAQDLTAAQLRIQLAILHAAWRAFDAVVEHGRGRTLTTGPRGGGRSLDKIVAHITESDAAYLVRLGGRFRPSPGGDSTAALREQIEATLRARAAGEPPAPSRSSKPPWTPRTFIRRSAWHALDHAWEIEDRLS